MCHSPSSKHFPQSIDSGHVLSEAENAWFVPLHSIQPCTLHPVSEDLISK